MPALRDGVDWPQIRDRNLSLGENSIIAGLRPYQTEVAGALRRLEALNPEFVNNAISYDLLSDQTGTLGRFVRAAN